MKKKMLSDYVEIINTFELIGAIDGYCARCVGRGKCPKHNWLQNFPIFFRSLSATMFLLTPSILNSANL
jgi:hypothetical protein